MRMRRNQNNRLSAGVPTNRVAWKVLPADEPDLPLPGAKPPEILGPFPVRLRRRFFPVIRLNQFQPIAGAPAVPRANLLPHHYPPGPHLELKSSSQSRPRN